MSRKKLLASYFAMAVLIGCGMFPVLNLTKMQMNWVSWFILIAAIWCYIEIGRKEATLFPQGSAVLVLGFNLSAVVVGLGCRYFLEFGEISNVYNFTLPNIALHITVAVLLSTGAWFFAQK